MKILNFCLSLLAIFLVGPLLAQPSMIKFQVGYGIPLINSPQWVSQSNNTVSVHSFSFGSGLRVEGGIIQPLRKNLAVQLDVAYLSGKRNSINQAVTTNYSNTTYYARFYDITPMIRFTLDDCKLKPYAAFGPAFGFGKFFRENESGTTPSSTTYTSKREYKGSFALGAKTELGLQIQSGKITYYAQLTVINMRYTPTSSEVTSYNANSVSQLVNLSVSQKQFVYVDSIDTQATQNTNQPTRALKTTYPFDSVSLNVGMMLTL